MGRTGLTNWAKLRELGRKQFVLRYGMLGWGVPTGILFTLVGGFRTGWDDIAAKMAIALVIFPLAGIVWGRLMWAFFEWMRDREVEV